MTELTLIQDAQNMAREILGNIQIVGAYGDTECTYCGAFHDNGIGDHTPSCIVHTAKRILEENS